MSILGKEFRKKLRVEPKLGILDALKSLGLDESLLVNDMVKGNIVMDAGRILGIPDKEIPIARLDEEQLEPLKKLIGKDGSYRTLDGVDMKGYAHHIAIAKNYKGDVVFAIKEFGRRNKGALRDTDIISRHTYNKDGIEMEYSAREYFSDEPDYSRSAIATIDIKRRNDLVTQTIQKTGNELSDLFRLDLPMETLRNGTVLIDEKKPEYLRKSAFPTETDYTNRNVHPYDQKNRLTALYKKTRFNFRNYPQMPKDTQQVMEQIERDLEMDKE